MRGPLAPAEAPLSRTRAQRFDDLVRDEAKRLERHWSRELTGVEFAVEEVPPVQPWADGSDAIPLSRLVPAASGRAPRIVVFRRPVEARGGDEATIAALVREVLVEEVAGLLGMSPESIDPTYDSPDD
jgi:predicted Zn-dependent protease with MMP-like domain